MKNIIIGGLAALALAGAVAVDAAPANADDLFIGCGNGAGVATSVTSCAFAHNVRYAYQTQPGQVVVAYSPVTGEYYNMQCAAGFVAHFIDGTAANSVRCVGGNNAVVVLW